MEHGFVSVPGARIYYEDYTPAPAPHRCTLIYHHGMTGASSQVGAFARSLSETGVRVVLLDSRGCGHTQCDHPSVATQYTQAQMAADLVAVANWLGIGRFHVGGQSYGTRVSLFTAAIAKGRVQKIVLVVPPPITASWGPADESMDDAAMMASFETMRIQAGASDPAQPTQEQLQARVPEWKAACTARKNLPDALAVREMRRAASNSLNHGFDTHKLQVVMDALAFPPTEEQLRPLLSDVPVLCLFGGEDRLTWTFLEKQQQLVLPHCQLVNFDKAGHEVTMELPDKCARAVSDFLLDDSSENWPMDRRTEFMTKAVRAGKASAAVYQARL